MGDIIVFPDVYFLICGENGVRMSMLICLWFNSSVHTSSFSIFFPSDDGQIRVMQFGSSMDRWLFHVPSAEFLYMDSLRLFWFHVFTDAY